MLLYGSQWGSLVAARSLFFYLKSRARIHISTASHPRIPASFRVGVKPGLWALDWTLGSGLDSGLWTGLWTDFWTEFWTPLHMRIVATSLL